MRLQPTMETILEFLTDENLSNPVKIKNQDDPDKFVININDPFIEDSKLRLGITKRFFDDGSSRIIFNGWKSSANLGDDYHGDFYKFIKLVKNFDTFFEAKEWFQKKYLLRDGSYSLDRTNIISHDKQCEEEKEKIYWSNSYEKFDPSRRKHLPYIKYLLRRKVPEDIILSLKCFIDHKSKRIIFPVYENNELIFYSKRSIVPHIFSWIKSKGDEVFPVWNLENIDGGTIYIFEGIFDAIYLLNAVALFGVGFGDEVMDKITKKKFDKYVVIMDNNLAGFRAKKKICTDLYENGYNTYIYNYYGIPETYGDFGEMAINNIPFDLENRVVKYDFKCQALMKLEKVK